MADDQVDRTNFEPGFNRNLDSFLEDINDRYAAQGITFRPTSGYRSMQEQQQLWDDYQAGKAKGLSDEQLVKAAPPGQSWHNWGGAADVMPFRDGKQLSNEEAIPILKQAGPLASGYGLTWGGGFGDMDHFQGGPKLGDWLDQTRRRNWQAPTATPAPDDDLRTSQVKALQPGAATAQYTYEAPPPGPLTTAATGTGGTPAPAGRGLVPALDQAIANASAKYGVPAEYLRTTAIIESAGGFNRNDSSTGAKGAFQFTRSTAAAYGVADPNDYGQASDGAARLALANKAALEQQLGRKVGWDEVYLAHQQGAPGAAGLLSRPNEAAGAVVGELAANVNGGRGMTAGAFANMWLSKYRKIAGGQWSPLPAAGAASSTGGGPDLSLAAAAGSGGYQTYVNPSASQKAADALAEATKPVAPAPPPPPAMAQTDPLGYAAAVGSGGYETQPLGPPAQAGGSLADVFASSLRSHEVFENANGDRIAAIEAVDRRNKVIQDALGGDVQLDNPLSSHGRQAWADEHRQYFQPFDQDRMDAIDQMRRNDYQQTLRGLAARYPELAPVIGAERPVLETAQAEAPAIGMEAHAKAEEAYKKSGGGFWPFMASMAGGFVGGLRDPMFAASAVVGGPEVKAASVAGRVAGTVVRDATLNAGVDWASQATSRDYRIATGRPAFDAEELGMAALFGGLLGAGVQGAHELGGLLARMARGDLGATAEVASHMPGDAGAPLRQVVSSEVLDRTMKPPPVPVPAEGGPTRLSAVSPAENAQKFRESIRFAEDPANQPKPEPPSAGLPPPPNERHLVDPVPADPAAVSPQPLPDGGPGTVVDYGGKPVHQERYTPSDIGTDAATFQYKGGADYKGVTDRLGGVAQWDGLASGKVIVFEREDGTKIIADGHQRLGLAQRLEATSPRPVVLDGYTFREADGWTPQDVRAIAAKKNIMEGSGDVLDTARVLRERPDLWDATMPMTDLKIKQAQGLARLSPEAWQMAINGVVPPNYAAALGRMVDKPELHAAIMGDLARFKPSNEHQARLIIGDALEAGQVRETQDSLFGPQEVTRTLTQERAQVYSATLGLLKDDKRIFAVLDREQSRIESEGNTLQPDANKARATRAGQLEQVFGTLASRAGPTSAALNRWATQVREGLAVAKAARGMAEELVQLAEKEGLRVAPREAELPKPSMPAETPAERQAQTETLRQQLGAPAEAPAAEGEAKLGTLLSRDSRTIERQAEAEAPKPKGEPDMFDAVPMVDDEGNMHTVDREEALTAESREETLSDLVASCK